MRTPHILLAAACVLALAACEKAAPPVPPPTPTTTLTAGTISIQLDVRPSILIEAESGEVRAPVVVREDAAASGGKFVIAPEGPEHAELSVGGNVTYRLHVAEPGRYTLWVRGNWCCSCGNSVSVSLDGGKAYDIEDAVLNKWHWVELQGHRPELTAGDHLLVVSNREDGAGWDQILLTQDPDYRPMDIEALDAQGRTAGVGTEKPAVTP